MQQRMMRGAKRALAMAAAVCLLAVASACTGPKLAADSFDDFCTRVIREMVGEDYVTIHFFFDDPDALGLGDVAPTFGRYTAEADEEEAERSAAMIRDLMRYDRDTLSQSQKKTYDLLLWTLQSAVPAAPMYYENPNAPNFGWQAQIQISLAELALDTEEDVENYLALLSDMPRYAEELMQYQQEKKEAGLGISAEQAELAIEECETFLQAGEENILLRSFDERIDGMEGLAQAQKESYKQRNREAVQTYCLPAYQTMAEGLEDTIQNPAFYMIPYVDKEGVENHIYINPKHMGDSVLPTLAHEGFPGHLYQTNYSRQTGDSVLCQLLEPTGYSEGWANYVENYSYRYLTENETAAQLCRINSQLSLNLYCQMDIGVNYLGWDTEELMEFAEAYFDVDAQGVEEMYQIFVASPGEYLQYYYTARQIEKAYDRASEALGSEFSDREFHRAVLEALPTKEGIEKAVDAYIEANGGQISGVPVYRAA